MEILYPNRWTHGVAMVRPETEFKVQERPNMIPPNCGAKELSIGEQVITVHECRIKCLKVFTHLTRTLHKQ